MQLIISTFTTIVAAGLMWLTVRGAHALTGSLPMTVVLAALVAVQWASARMAIAAFRASTHAFGGRLLRALGFGAIWLVAATITVSFVGGELFEMFSATNTATERFERTAPR